MMRLDETAKHRAGISDSPISPAALRRAHRAKNLGVEFIDDQPETDSNRSGLFGRLISVQKRGASSLRMRKSKPSLKPPAPTKASRPRPIDDKPRKVAARSRKAASSDRGQTSRRRWTIED